MAQHATKFRGTNWVGFQSLSIDWRRRSVKDAIVIFGLALIVYAVSSWLNAFEAIQDLVREHEDWQVDELFILSFVMSIAMVVYGYRRLTDLAREIAARRAAEREAQKLARHDALTGLPNRRYFSEKLEAALNSPTAGGRLALLMLDLDGFKSINDRLGHASGDQALIEFTARLTPLLTDGASLARVGGDEFSILMPSINSPDRPAALARQIVTAMGEPFGINGPTIMFGVGIGIAIAPENGTEAEQLVRRADVALYRAKAQGPCSIRFFEAGMDSHLERRASLERELRAALADGTVVPFYQPLMSLESDRIIGFEALARRHSDEFGDVPPEVFIPLAEESGLITELAAQLLRRACQDAKQWPADTILAFNISPVQLRDPTLGLRVLALLGETGFDPRRLELEITESALIRNLDVAQKVIEELRNAGVRIALDDFGTGYATLSHLLTLHLDKLKIDRSFVEHLKSDPESLIIVRAILGIAQGFGMSTTAEGIESADQLTWLKANGCTEGQGFIFSEALPTAKITELLASLPRRAAGA